MPNASDHFAGLLNLRGEILGVLDLAKIFGYSSEGGNSQSILVLDGEGMGLSVKVDLVSSVQSIPREKIDFKPKVVMPIESKFLIGLTEQNGNIVPIIALSSVISTTDVAVVRGAQAAA